MADEANRDSRQRSLGCVGASMVVHVGLLALLALAPESEALQPLGTPDGLAPGAVTVELENTPASGNAEPSSAAATQSADQPSEVMLASNDDPTAVAMPTKEAEVVKPKAIAAPVIKESPKPKIAKVAPAPKAPKAPITSNESDVEIQKALVAAREEKQEIAQKEEVAPPATTEPEEPMAKPEEEEEEIETAKAPVAEATIAAAAAAPAQQEAPAPTEFPPAKEEAPKAAALVQKPAAAPSQQPMAAAAAAPMSAQPAAPIAAMPSQASGGTSPQPGIAAAQPGPNAAGQSVRAGGLGYSVPMGVRIRDASELVARPGNPSPIYPQQDRLLGRQGLAVVVGRVSNDGSILTVQLERSSGSASMDQEAMKTFAKWKFMPGQQGLVRKPFQFVLTGAAKELPARLRR